MWLLKSVQLVDVKNDSHCSLAAEINSNAIRTFSDSKKLVPIMLCSSYKLQVHTSRGLNCTN